MPRLEPFRAYRFSVPADDLPSLLAPPYDVVSDPDRRSLGADPHNTVHLTLPEGDERYHSAAETLAAWLADGTLIPENPAVYLYEQTSEVAGSTLTVRGLLAAVAVDEVTPHERVYDKIVDDRFSLLQATDTELEAIVAIYDGDNGETRGLLDEVQAAAPDLEVDTPFDGDRHRLWRIDDGALLEKIRSDLAGRTAVIADGHHRWTTARRHASSMGREHATQLMLLQDIGAQGPALLAIHRVVVDITLEEVRTALAPWFDLDEVTAGDPDSWAADLREDSQQAFIFFDGKQAIRAAVANALSPLLPSDMPASVRRLDVAILHEAVFDELLGKREPSFVHTPGEAADLVASEGGVAVLLRPTPLAAVLEVAGEGSLMPRKSTFFLPKPVSGLLFRPLP